MWKLLLELALRILNFFRSKPPEVVADPRPYTTGTAHIPPVSETNVLDPFGLPNPLEAGPQAQPARVDPTVAVTANDAAVAQVADKAVETVRDNAAQQEAALDNAEQKITSLSGDALAKRGNSTYPAKQM